MLTRSEIAKLNWQKPEYRFKVTTRASEALKQPEVRKKISLAKKGVPCSNEVIEKLKKIREKNKTSLKYIWMRPEFRLKMKTIYRKRSEIPRKPWTEEQRIKHRKRICTPEHSAILRERFKTRRGTYTNTSIERKLQSELLQKRIEYKTQSSLTGRPDIFIEPNICIFADGDYWHNKENHKKRDFEVDTFLNEKNYIVLRFWEHEINSDIDYCIKTILFVYNNLKDYRIS